MKFSLFGRLSLALFASLVLGLGMTGCGGGTIAYLWVLGQQYNQIAGFQVDDYTGNLTAIPHSPFATNGSNPVSIVVKPGGRFVFVLNQGTGASAAGPGTSAGIAVFSVGGTGALTYQATYQSQGFLPQWLALDSTGNYLYELDKYSPSYVASTGQYTGPNKDGFGAITAFSIDATTGRLSLVTNATVLNGNVNTPFFEVGGSPIMMKSQGSCLLTVNQADNSISPYVFASGGQLNFTGSTGRYSVGGVATINSINGSGSYVYLTDPTNNNILAFNLGTGCTLSPVTGGITPNEAGASNPDYTLLDSSGKFLYVLNRSQVISGSSTQAYSYISAFNVSQTNGQLSAITDAPYTVGSGPVCVVEDPTNQYLYISNYNDGTVTGKHFDPTTGRLSDLTRGSTFTATGQATCLALSGSVD